MSITLAFLQGHKKSLIFPYCFMNGDQFIDTNSFNHLTFDPCCSKKLCYSSILGQNLDLVNSHFTTDRVMSFIFQQDITLYVGHHCWNFDKNQ